MAKAEQKTKPTKLSVEAYFDAIPDEKRRGDCRAIDKLMQKLTKEKPAMWGTAIVGYGSYHYKYASGREGESCKIGFSARKSNITLYLMGGFNSVPDQLKKLGKHKTGGGCLYINSLDDIDMKVLEKILAASMKELKTTIAKRQQ